MDDIAEFILTLIWELLVFLYEEGFFSAFFGFIYRAVMFVPNYLVHIVWRFI